MKRFIIPLLVVFLSVTLMGCSSGSSKHQNTQTNNEVIRFAPAYVVLDDAGAKIEVLSVSHKVCNPTNEKAKYHAYLICFRIENKSDHYDLNITINSGDTRIGDHVVAFANGIYDVKPGKKNHEAYLTATTGSSASQESAGVEHISSVEDLLTLRCRFTIRFLDESKHTVSTQELSFSLEDVESSTIKR